MSVVGPTNQRSAKQDNDPKIPDYNADPVVELSRVSKFSLGGSHATQTATAKGVTFPKKNVGPSLLAL